MASGIHGVQEALNREAMLRETGEEYGTMVEIWRSFIKDETESNPKTKNFRLPAIVPIVLYNGHTTGQPVGVLKNTNRGEKYFLYTY